MALAPPVTPISATCCDVCDGSALTRPTGGAAPYTYNWDDPGTQTTANAANLCDGDYTLIVTDASGCTDTTLVTITEPLALSSSISAVGVDCNGDCDGTAVITVTDGTAPYTYLWSNGQTASLAINLCAGTYYVTVTDNNGCTLIDSAIITEPLALSNLFTSTDVLCNVDTT